MDRAQLAGPRTGRAAVAGLVAQGRRRRAEPAARQRGEPGEGRSARRCRRAREQPSAPGVRQAHIGSRVLPPGEDPAPGRPAPGRQVDPGGGVREPVAARGETGQQVVQVPGTLGGDRHQPRGDTPQPQRGAQDHPGQPEAPGGRVEEGGARQDRPHLAVGGEQLQGAHVPGEGPRPPMVEAGRIGADRPADRHPARPRQQRRQPAERQQHPQQPFQAHPRVAAHHAGGGIHPADPGQARQVEHRPARVLRRVPGRPPQPARDDAPGPASPDDGGRLLVTTGPETHGGRRGGAAPAGQGHGVDGHEGDRIVREITFAALVKSLTGTGDGVSVSAW